MSIFVRIALFVCLFFNLRIYCLLLSSICDMNDGVNEVLVKLTRVL